MNLNFSNGQNEYELSNIVIVEVKQDRSSISEFMKELHNSRIQPFGISKYCLGVILFNESIKYNRFKKNLLTLNKLEPDFNFPHINCEV